LFFVFLQRARFTVKKPENWLIHGGYAAQQILKSVNYQLDGKHSDLTSVNSALESPFDYSVNLTNLTDGVHSLKVYAYASGWVIQMNGFYEYEVPINSSSIIVYFTVDTTSPQIMFLSLEKQTYCTSNVPLNFTVSELTTQIKYSLDGQENVTIAGNETLTNLPYGARAPFLFLSGETELTGNSTLTGLSNGMHNITVTVVTERGSASQNTYFSINIDDENENASTANNPIPTIPVVAGSIGGIATVGVSRLFYFKKRRRLRST
jgi:hypothetical protein